MNLDQLQKIAEAAAVLDHNETDRWYTADELMADYVSAKEAVWYHKNARLMAACDPKTVLRLIAVARAAAPYLYQYEDVYDSIDNNGRQYQSQSAADAEAALRSALAGLDAQQEPT